MAVSRCHANPNREFSHRQGAGAMNAKHQAPGMSFLGLGGNSFTFQTRQLIKCLVFKVSDQSAGVMIPDPAFEDHASARFGPGESRP